MGRLGSIFIIIPGGVILVCCSFYVFVDTIANFSYGWLGIICSVIFLLMGLLVLLIGVKGYSFESRKYLITKEGLYLNDRKNPFVAWDQLNGIGIYPFGTTASLQVYDKVICFFLSPCSENFFNNFFKDTRFFAERNQDKFVVIDYDEAIIKALSAVYQKDIIDYTEGMDGHIRNM